MTGGASTARRGRRDDDALFAGLTRATSMPCWTTAAAGSGVIWSRTSSPTPFSTARRRLDDVEIVAAAINFARMSNGFDAEMGRPFAAWLLANHPADADLLFTDKDLTQFRITEGIGASVGDCGHGNTSRTSSRGRRQPHEMFCGAGLAAHSHVPARPAPQPS